MTTAELVLGEKVLLKQDETRLSFWRQRVEISEGNFPLKKKKENGIITGGECRVKETCFLLGCLLAFKMRVAAT